MLKDVLDRIESRLEALGLSATAASRHAGLSLDAIRNMRRKVQAGDIHAGVSSRTIDALAPVLGTTASWLLTGDEPNSENASPDLVATRPTTPLIPGRELLGTGTMPVYAAAMGGDGHVIVTFDEIDRVKRPAELENVRGGYGLLIKGTSMVPAINEGDTALVNPHLPPARGANVILYHTPPDGSDNEAMVKQLLNWTDKEWTLKQWNPPEEFKEYRQEWPVCHRVVGVYYGR
ncbi:MAG TPA: S24 family peptidase [Pelagibacterium sp.]|uniref:XRE family transcriptional regulator n=1 Tax=Pelagibacterium sp. TaxID=1967288 RepID=UPI002BDEAC37|nr:S24 family peptidase [Pelagibacterium sp.]HWJ88535.1 S24 family peptidase [Pelagibacterium sp.]